MENVDVFNGNLLQSIVTVIFFFGLVCHSHFVGGGIYGIRMFQSILERLNDQNILYTARSLREDTNTNFTELKFFKRRPRSQSVIRL